MKTFLDNTTDLSIFAGLIIVIIALGACLFLPFFGIVMTLLWVYLFFAGIILIFVPAGICAFINEFFVKM